MRIDILNSKDFILECIKNNLPKCRISLHLKCKPTTLNSYLTKMDIEYKGNVGCKGIKKGNKKTVIEYLKGGNISSYVLKNKLLNEGYKEHKCENCNQSEWLNNPIPLELHHIDGNHYNNDLNNIQVLCPNCHALTENYRGKNVKSKGVKSNNKILCDCGKYKTYRATLCIECAKNKPKKEKKEKKDVCPTCQTIKNIRSKKCINCSKTANRKVDRPPYEILINYINEYGYRETGKKYSVSDNSIRKWIKFYETHNF